MVVGTIKNETFICYSSHSSWTIQWLYKVHICVCTTIIRFTFNVDVHVHVDQGSCNDYNCKLQATEIENIGWVLSVSQKKKKLETGHTVKLICYHSFIAN